MTKAQAKKALQAKLDEMHAQHRENIAAMQEASANPQVALMIEKNKGYIMALEDVVELLYSRKIF